MKITAHRKPLDRPPDLTVLNFSGGKQSTCLLWQVIRGEIPRPDPFLVVTADPGMEATATYKLVDAMEAQCLAAGLEFRRAQGPDLYRDIVEMGPETSRIDNPPYFTDNGAGTRGRLMQKCTKQYKIRPIQRAVRAEMARIGISPRPNAVETWIGLSRNEVHRIKPPSVDYQYFRYPLIEQGLTVGGVLDYFKARDLTTPARSMCNGCFAQGPAALRSMAVAAPQDFAQAVAVDEAIRDWTQLGIENPVYMSNTLRPVREIGESNEADDPQMVMDFCDSGFCFV